MRRIPNESANLFEGYSCAAIFVTIFRAVKRTHVQVVRVVLSQHEVMLVRRIHSFIWSCRARTDGGSLDEDPHGKPGPTSQATTHCVRLGADDICRS